MKDGTSHTMELMFLNFQMGFQIYKIYIAILPMDNIATTILECIAI